MPPRSGDCSRALDERRVEIVDRSEALRWLEQIEQRLRERRAQSTAGGLNRSPDVPQGTMPKADQDGEISVRSTASTTWREAPTNKVSLDTSARARSEVSDVCHALCSLVAEAEFSHKAIPALLAVIAAAEGYGPDEFFRQSGIELGRRLGKLDASEQGYARRWSRAWRLIEAEQQRTGLTLVERQQGGKDPRTKRKQCSEYRVPLAQIVVDVMQFARQFSGKGIRRGDQYERAARRVVALLPRNVRRQE